MYIHCITFVYMQQQAEFKRILFTVLIINVRRRKSCLLESRLQNEFCYLEKAVRM